MSGVFISYRREDAASSAGRLFDHLAGRLGRQNVFMDVDAMEPGVDFHEVLDQRVANCDALIAVIGRDWLTVTTADGQRRLERDDDFVRIEIASALSRNVRVIPLLVDGAGVPAPEDLPDDLKPLARRNAVEITHARFVSDVDQLGNALARLIDVQAHTPQPQQAPAPGAPVGQTLTMSQMASAMMASLSNATASLSIPRPAPQSVSQPEPRPVVSPPIAQPVVPSSTPVEHLITALTPYADEQKIFVTPRIPNVQLQNAQTATLAPTEERAIALVDFTRAGNGRQALLITTNALYAHNRDAPPPHKLKVTLNYLARNPLSRHGFHIIGIGEARLTISGGPDLERMFAMLSVLKEAASETE